MALQKQAVPINFSLGLDTKTDPKQVQLGKFLTLKNTVFDKAGGLVKRNGYPALTALPNAEQTTLATLSGNLIATGSNLYAYNAPSSQWLNQGTIHPVHLSTISLVKNSTSQSSPDTAATESGLACLVYVDSAVSYYHIVDRNTGYQVVSRTAIAGTTANPRVFLVGKYFVVTYLTASSLNYIVIPTANPTIPSSPLVLSATVSGINAGYDGCIASNGSLYVSWADGTGGIKIITIDNYLHFPYAVQTIAAHTATRLSVTADASNSTVYTTFYDGTDIYTACFSYTLAPILTATFVETVTIKELTSTAQLGVLTVIYENINTYGFTPSSGSTVATDYLSKITVTQAGTAGTSSIIVRSVGLASKAFIDTAGTIYMLAAFAEANQNTYFLIDTLGDVYMRLAATNGGGYSNTQVLPSVEYVNGVYTIPYLMADFLATINKGTDLPAGTPVNAIYTQTGVNLAAFTLNVTSQYSSEIANALHLTGGQLWEYDGVKPVEHGFHVFPSPNTATTANNGAISTATGSGSIAAGTYYYSFTYEWTDNQGNLHRSAPSIPISIVTTTSSSTNTIYVPTLRLTYKTAPNPVRIVGYRWSVAQQVYYQFTSITSPTLNDPSVDYVTFVDAKSDLQILGQTLLYTTGGVVENIAAPASIASALFKNRLFLIDAEDPNLIWYSKQVIQAVPVEMSDLLTLYVAPTSGAQGSTGSLTALSAMDDKLIIFKRDAIYYITGTGPDNTGASNDFSDPIYITSSVGCSNPNSIVLMPNGLMFQSDKGIWLLGRDLSTTYIGAPVEAYNDFTVKSAKTVPATNQVRFTLSGDVTLMYDYYYQQWGTFSNLQAISATLYQGMDTYLNIYGKVYQEQPGTYLDGSSPVLMSFTTGWINIAGVQGYERFYQLLVLGNYYTPFRLNMQLSYDYATSPTQATLITPDNYSAPWGGEAQWGSGEFWGGPGNVFEARLFPERQKCESFQITMNEVFDASFGTTAGQGLSLSGLNMLIGVKKGTRAQKASQSFG